MYIFKVIVLPILSGIESRGKLGQWGLTWLERSSKYLCDLTPIIIYTREHIPGKEQCELSQAIAMGVGFSLDSGWTD